MLDVCIKLICVVIGEAVIQVTKCIQLNQKGLLSLYVGMVHIDDVCLF